MRLTVVLAALLALPLGAQQPSPPRPPTIPRSGPVPREPAAERKLQAEFTAPAGFDVTLFAGPPVAMYPTCVAEGADGAVYVCVDPNLSLSTLRGVGRMMRLVDTDNDGRADRYTTFAEMDSPRGAVFDGKTLYVMHPPNLTAYRDTTGDGIADVSRDIVTGLGFDLDFRGADHTTNNIHMGIDGWLYVAVGDYGFIKAVGSDRTQIQNRGGAVVRVRPDGTNLEVVAVGTRNIYDVAIDPFLNLFARDNTNDGDGWNTRLHYIPTGAHLGYPSLYQNFAAEHFPTMHDYGAGSGVGALWIQDPAWPAGQNNTLYTADWTVQKIFRHPLAPKGASFGVEQQDFIGVLRPADLVMDASSNLYVASLSGGQFTYATDTVGYVVRVRYTGSPPSTAPDVARLTDAQLVAVLGTPNAVHRQHAQQELLRRGAKDATIAALRTMAASASTSAESRVAALFTLKQLAGERATPALLPLVTAPDARVRAAALRALADRRDQLAGVSSAPFVTALADADAHVRVQALAGLMRLGARDAVEAIVPLTGSDDQAMRHLAVRALASLGGRDAALKAVDAGAPAARAGALQALALMHDPVTVGALTDRAARARDAATRRELLRALARLHNREGYWRGDWWTTKPAHLGPYFDPAAWEESPRIRAVLRSALASASGAELDALADLYALEQVLPRGAKPLLAAVTAARDPRRGALIDALVGRSQLDAASVEIASALDRTSPALHGAVVQLLAGESTFGAGAIPLVRAAVLDTKLAPALRGQLLTAMAQVPGRDALDVAAEVFARLNPVPGLPAAATPAAAASAAPTPPAGSGATAAGAPDAVESAWRRFVGDRRRVAEIDYFVAMARSAPPAQRTLAFAVLVQAVRTPRTPAAVREKVTPVIEAAWSDPASAPSLVQAITLMRVESQYAERLQAYNQQRKP